MRRGARLGPAGEMRVGGLYTSLWGILGMGSSASSIHASASFVDLFLSRNYRNSIVEWSESSKDAAPALHGQRPAFTLSEHHLIWPSKMRFLGPE